MLGRGNLTVKERYLLLIHNDIQKTKTGKDVLTEADKSALENWKASTNEEARAWNQLNEGWKLGGRMDLEAEFAYKDAQIAYMSQKPMIIGMLFYPLQRRANLYLHNLERIKKVTIEEAGEIAMKQKEIKLKEGVDFDYAVYQLAFELLGDKDHERMEELYPEVEYDHQYLDQEEVIAHLYEDQKELSEKAKDKLAELVAEQSYNKFAKEYQLFHYFACIPLLEVARYFLKSRGIEFANDKLPKNQEAPEDESLHDKVTSAIQKYADEHSTNIKALLREACRHWLDNGLLEEYTPLVSSNDSELLSRWFKTKTKARKTLNQHITSGELTVRNREAEETRIEKLYSKGLIDSELKTARIFFEVLELDKLPKDELEEKKAFETFNDKVLTGESLYNFKGKYEFVEDFKKRADTYDPNLGLVYAEDDSEHKGKHLDQELLICQRNSEGEPVFFSQYGMGLKIISSFFSSLVLFKEFKKEEKTFLKFKNDDISVVFKEHRQMFIDNYATLLGFENIFQKLSPIYETDMTDHVSARLTTLREYATEFNRAIRKVTNAEEDSEKAKKRWLSRKEVIPFEEDMLINLEDIKPDSKIISEYEEKIKEIFPGI